MFPFLRVLALACEEADVKQRKEELSYSWGEAEAR